MFAALFVTAELIVAAYALGIVNRAYQWSRFETYTITTLTSRFDNAPRLQSFTVANPYAVPGPYRKAQLHLHTSNSADVTEKVPVEDTLRQYYAAGYSFAVISDHDTITPPPELGYPDFVVIPGEEKTIPYVCWPFGKHLVRIGAERSDGRHPISRKRREEIRREEFISPAHLNWRGNLGTARWYLQDLLDLERNRLIEVFNGRSHSIVDFVLWHKLLEKRGPANPVWAVAVDDSDNAKPIDMGWIMMKTAEVSKEAFFDALRNGAFYATTGPLMDLRVDDGVIRLETTNGAWIRFINAKNEVVSVSRGDFAEYRPVGDEGFVRVEVVNDAGRPAWSQPFFLLPRD